MLRSFFLLACLALAACAGGGGGSDDDEGPGEGAERGPCYANQTCNAGLVCASSRCVRLDGAAGASTGGAAGKPSTAGSAGQSSGGGASPGGMAAAGFAGASGGGGVTGTGGTATAGTAGSAGATTAGASGAGVAGASGAASSGAAGAAGSGLCEFPKHVCGGACVANTPDTGCATSDTCAPCVAPANADAICTAGGACGFNCAAGFMLQGGACVAQQGGGGSTGGGAKCPNCVGNCAFPLEDYNCLLDCLIDGLDCRWDKTKMPACECF